MDAASASIIAAVIAAVGGLLAAYLNKVHKDNRSDHSYVADRLGDLHVDVKDLKKDITEVKIDVGVLKSRHKDLDNKVNRLEEHI